MSSVDRRGFLGTSLAGAEAAWAATGPAATGPAARAKPTDLSRLGRTPRTKFAVNVEIWWRKLPFLDHFAKAAQLGLPAIEFWLSKGRGSGRRLVILQ